MLNQSQSHFAMDKFAKRLGDLELRFWTGRLISADRISYSLVDQPILMAMVENISSANLWGVKVGCASSLHPWSLTQPLKNGDLKTILSYW